jgi:two-component system, response regulator
MNGHDIVEILLVEDNPYDAELTITALKENNLANQVHHVKDGNEALDYLFDPDGFLRQKTPHVILLDMKLPKIHGLEVLRRIKSDEKARKIPVVVFTSSNQESDVEECYRLGVNSFITKPLEFESFAKVVSSLGLYWLLLNKQPARQA